MAYAGITAGNFPVGIIREIVGSRQNFSFAHATEAYKISLLREPATYDFNSSQMTKAIMGQEFVDLYSFECKVPDTLLTVPRMKNWYMASKEPNNLRLKVLTRNNTVQYINMIADGGTPSQDGSTETGSSLVSLVPTFTVDNTMSKCELDFFGGITPGQALWLATNATGAKTGGTGGTGATMTAMTNSRTDRHIAGIYRVDVGGVQVNLLTKENCKWEMKGVVPSDRKSYADLQFVNAYQTTGVVEMMGMSYTAEILQAITDEISASGTQPAVKFYMQGGLIVSYAAGTCTVRPEWHGYDSNNTGASGHLTLNVSYEAQFNTDEATPDSIDFGTTTAGTLLFKALT